jgi:maltose alpha-D-glucosyltransferase/alpha-amylase
MLRSFNYAAHTALAQVIEERPADLAKFEVLIIDWEAEVGRVFLSAYNEVVSNSGLFAPNVSKRGLLDLFLLEKALYELRYELDNRPNWVGIPLLGILSLLQAKS